MQACWQLPLKIKSSFNYLSWWAMLNNWRSWKVCLSWGKKTFCEMYCNTYKGQFACSRLGFDYPDLKGNSAGNWFALKHNWVFMLWIKNIKFVILWWSRKDDQYTQKHFKPCLRLVSHENWFIIQHKPSLCKIYIFNKYVSLELPIYGWSSTSW